MGTNRWAVYQRERFPLAGHVPLVAAFSCSAVSFSALLRDHASAPDWRSTFVAFVTSLLFFFQLRVADEFKDASEDARYRPYRPVPRGLVTLRELGALAVCALAIQAALAAWLTPSLLLLLMPVWGYLLLMQREFFAAEWLRARPVAYIATHMAIVPLIDLYATACDWWVAGSGHPPAALTWFLVVSLGNGFVIELGRKIRAPIDEEYGVQTYSALWGTSLATRAWLAALTAAGVSALIAASSIAMTLPLAAAIVALLVACVVTARRFVAAPATAGGKRFEALSWLWTVSMYVTLGLVPLAWRTLGA
jgi:4-hydroxybenzoate polyprenyltransferase